MEKYTKDMIPDFKEDIAYYVKDMKRILKNAPKVNKINRLSYHKFFELDRKVERLHTLCILLELNLDVEVWGQKNFGEVLINKTYKFNLVKKKRCLKIISWMPLKIQNTPLIGNLYNAR